MFITFILNMWNQYHYHESDDLEMFTTPHFNQIAKHVSLSLLSQTSRIIYEKKSKEDPQQWQINI